LLLSRNADTVCGDFDPADPLSVNYDHVKLMESWQDIRQPFLIFWKLTSWNTKKD
jgi:hypothetical protein